MSEYTPRKGVDEAFALPPLPAIPFEIRGRMIAYGHACAEHARAPLAEENARLKERIAELEADAEIGKRWRKNSSLEEWFPITAEEIDRLRAEVEALLGIIEAVRDWDVSGALDATRSELFAIPQPLRARISAAIAARKGEGSEP